MPFRASRLATLPFRSPEAVQPGSARAGRTDAGRFPAMGNQALQHLLRSRALQAKLTISQPGDPYEQEADRVTDAVMRMPEPETADAAPVPHGGGQPLPALAHELTHVVQQVPGIARQPEPVPAPPLTIDPEAVERALRFRPRFREHTPAAPRISPPPILVDEQPAVCPSAQAAAQAIRNGDIRERTRNRMQFSINQSARQPKTRVTSAMIGRADRAIRAEFGALLPAGRSYRSPRSVTIQTPQQLAQLRAPDPATARRRIGQAALANDEDAQLLASQCITTPDHPVLAREVTRPLFRQLGISFVQDFEQAHIGGQTTGAGTPQAHVDLPRESRNIGHIVVHEGLHFYTHDTYARTASGDPRERELMEGGAEFLARHVIRARLVGVPAFEINPRTYSSEFSYVSRYLLRGGLGTFARALLQGRVDLIGLTPPTSTP